MPALVKEQGLVTTRDKEEDGTKCVLRADKKVNEILAMLLQSNWEKS